MFGNRSLQVLAVFAAILLAPGAAFANPEVWKIEGWKKTDFSKSSIDFREILSGGPPKDGIPAIDKPRFETLSDANALKDNVPVIGLKINGDARAYPIPILMWHEIVNDTIGGEPVTVTYCPLCNAALVFHRKVGDQVLDFGTTGKLRNSDLVMYDRQTESWWQQFTGQAIVGQFLGTELKLLPSRLESFADFKARHPNGKILIPNNPAFRPYGRNPYVRYDSAARPFLYRGSMPEGIEPMARVVVVRNDGRASAISMQAVREKKSVVLDGVTITWKPGQASALDAADISKGRDVGGIIAQRKTAGSDPIDVPYDVTFAFVFHAFHPKGKILTQ